MAAARSASPRGLDFIMIHFLACQFSHPDSCGPRKHDIALQTQLQVFRFPSAWRDRIMEPLANPLWRRPQALGLLVLVSVLGVTVRVHAQSATSDPVAELAKVLAQHPQPPSAEALKIRQESIQKRAKSISTLGDLARA